MDTWVHKYLDHVRSPFQSLTVITGFPGGLLVRPGVAVAEGLLPHRQEFPQVVVRLRPETKFKIQLRTQKMEKTCCSIPARSLCCACAPAWRCGGTPAGRRPRQTRCGCGRQLQIGCHCCMRERGSDRAQPKVEDNNFSASTLLARFCFGQLKV